MFSVGEDSLTDQTVEKYKSVITENGGSIDRHEDWGSLRWLMTSTMRIKQGIYLSTSKRTPSSSTSSMN